MPENITPFTRRMYELCEMMPKRVAGYFPGDFHRMAPMTTTAMKRVAGYFPGDFHRALINAGDDFATRA